MELYGFLSDIKALAGMLYDANPKDIVSYPALEDIDFGRGIFLSDKGVAQKKYTDKAFLFILLISPAFLRPLIQSKRHSTSLSRGRSKGFLPNAMSWS